MLTTEEGIPPVQRALREMDLDGWLLYEFQGHNTGAVAQLGLGKPTRRGFDMIPDV